MKEAFIKSNFWIGLLAFSVALSNFCCWLQHGFCQEGTLVTLRSNLLPDLVTSTFDFACRCWSWCKYFRNYSGLFVVMVEFPGRAWLEWALFLPFGIPAYVLAFVYLGVFDYSGYAQVWLREYLGIPGFDIRSGHWAIILTFILGFLSLCLYDGKSIFQTSKNANDRSW